MLLHFCEMLLILYAHDVYIIFGAIHTLSWSSTVFGLAHYVSEPFDILLTLIFVPSKMLLKVEVAGVSPGLSSFLQM